jgi:hypothetical protein
MRPTVQRIVAESFELVEHKQDFDFIRDIALRVPGMTGLAFLGVPQDETVLGFIHSANARLQEYMQNFGDDPKFLVELKEAHRTLQTLWGPTIEERRHQPTGDLISKLWEMRRSRLDWDGDEIIRQCLFFFGASFGNTANTIANIAYVLADDNRWQQVLREDAHRIPNFVDEVLRVWASVQFRIRIASKDLDLAGQRIRNGDRVIVVVASANRDETQFANPNEIDIERPGSRHHLTFGVGQRYCVGASLARVESEEVVRAMLADNIVIRFSDDDIRPSFTGLNYRVWAPLRLQLRISEDQTN